MYLLERKAYSSVSLPICIANYQALLAKYNFLKEDKVLQQSERLPQETRKLRAVMPESELVKTALQASVDTSDTAARSNCGH